MSYQQYGISTELVERIKLKLKDPYTKERVKTILSNVSKFELQDRTRVKKLLSQIAKVMNEKISEQQAENIVTFVVAQRIDPNNTFHLIKLWSMFR